MARCRTYGHGPRRIIAIHGWFNDSAAFDGMLAGFDPDRFCIALPDMRGYGSRRASEGPFDISTMAEDVLAVADTFSWQSFTVMGHSMGGKVALRVALMAGQRVERIIGITPVWAGKAPFDPATLDFFRAAAHDVAVRQAILDMTTGQRLPAAWLRRAAERSVAVSNREAFADTFESWAGDEFATAAQAVEQPVLVVAGAQDRGVPEELVRSTWLASLRNAHLVVMPEAGHYPMDECPLILASHLIAFIDPALAR
ncbi:alpha/beta fold hydrolase [Sphingomonas sp. PR090111-T3T-6A]|uniref:alpha/beta fold hydrolase n=1 Tax=Sphingomonas sp. PR090111-T3T-6A TaxID=685778 RepID=UPI0003656409|nr:alpha/beta hydrolase [Sphingomonas sp. PR090111-T3T-6A]